MRTPLADLIDSYPDLGNRLSLIWGNIDTEDSSLPFNQRMEFTNDASQYRCDALIILPFSLHVVPLDCSLEDLRICQKSCAARYQIPPGGIGEFIAKRVPSL